MNKKSIEENNKETLDEVLDVEKLDQMLDSRDSKEELLDEGDVALDKIIPEELEEIPENEIMEEKKENNNIVDESVHKEEDKFNDKNIKNNNLKKQKNSKFPIIFIVILLLGITIGSFFLGYGTNFLKSKKKKVLSYTEAKDKSEEIIKAQEQKKTYEEQIKKLTEKEPTVEEKIKEEKKSEIYKEYENLPEDKKEEIDAIPREEEVPIEVIDEIIEEQEEEQEEDIVIPTSFNLKDVIDIQVENQGARGLCWDFASIKSLETHLALKEGKNYDFSEQHLNYITSNLLYGFRLVDDGGNFGNFEDYMLQSGVVEEKTVPYEKDYGESDYSKFLDMEPIKIVTSTVNFPSIYKNGSFKYSEEDITKFRTAVKRHIMKNGSIYAAISAFANSFAEDKRNYYVSEENPNYFFPNHAISIVGWDDEYSRENFKDGDYIPEHDGAYIALNSWGQSAYTDENGKDTAYFYISYEDLYVETDMNGISSTEINKSNAIALDDIKSKSIKNEIMKKFYYGLKDYNNKQYATKLLFSKFGILKIDNDEVSSNELKFFTNLHHLEIIHTKLKDLKVLPKMDDLNTLVLDDNEIENVDELSKFSNLRSISLKNNKIKDVSSLQGIEIQELDISGNKGVTGYGKLNVINNLKLENMDLKELEKFTNTVPTSLFLSNNQFENLNSIPDKINRLFIVNNKLEKLDGIERLSNLLNLDISKNKITDFTALKELSNKEIENDGLMRSSGGNSTIGLHLIYSDSDVTDITIFNDFNFVYLDLSNNKITTLDGYKPGEKLESLDVSNNLISDITNYVPNDNLETINLMNNKLKDISSFKNNNLSNILLSGNKGLSGYGKLNVRNISIIDCNINELESISNEVTDLYADKNSIKDVSVLSDAKKLVNLSINDNKVKLSGTIKNDSLYSFMLTNTKIDDNFVIDCSNLFYLKISTLKFPTDVADMIYVEGVDVTEDILKNIPSNVYLLSSNFSIDVKSDNNRISLEDMPLLDFFNNLNYYIDDSRVVISKNRKDIILLGDIDKLYLGPISICLDDRYYYLDITLNVSKSNGFLGSIKELFKNISWNF